MVQNTILSWNTGKFLSYGTGTVPVLKCKILEGVNTGTVELDFLPSSAILRLLVAILAMNAKKYDEKIVLLRFLRSARYK
jgi:hypothetical protein